MPSKKNKRKRPEQRPTIHRRNKYADTPPNFAELASLYPSFEPFVFYSRDGRPRIDWTDFNATRELTKVLLLHDHSINWWIPDGQLCPTVPNRSNYIHWIEDLLSSEIIPKNRMDGDVVKGFDIGTGANCIYPLLSASLLGWSFVGSDITDVALEWAERNVRNNPHVAELIEIRRVPVGGSEMSTEELAAAQPVDHGSKDDEEAKLEPSCSLETEDVADSRYCGPHILLGVVKEGEKFDFCMCNPPFFESIEEAGLNPKTACGGTPEEMVCHGGEQAFVTRMIDDSVVLKDSFRWYTSMLGRKINLKLLTSKLREVGATVVKTTEFVQGQTCRWGLAWSFLPPARKIISPSVAVRTNISFMLERVQRQFSAIHVLQSVETLFQTSGAYCKLNAASFTIDITTSMVQCEEFLKYDAKALNELSDRKPIENALDTSSNNLSFRISIFQQQPGTLLVKASLHNKDCPFAGMFSSVIHKLEEVMSQRFCRARDSAK
ncbi:RNA N6-adenosine-methyltransferase mettl16 [Linum perenne]